MQNFGEKKLVGSGGRWLNLVAHMEEKIPVVGYQTCNPRSWDSISTKILVGGW